MLCNEVIFFCQEEIHQRNGPTTSKYFKNDGKSKESIDELKEKLTKESETGKLVQKSQPDQSEKTKPVEELSQGDESQRSQASEGSQSSKTGASSQPNQGMIVKTPMALLF